MTFAGFVLLAILFAAPLSAAEDVTYYDAGSTLGSFLALGGGARPIAMGSAFTAVADDSSAVSWNPGGLGQVTAKNAIAMYDMVGEGIGLGFLAGSLPLGPGVAGLNVWYHSFGEYDLRDETGKNLGTASDTDFAVAGAYAIRNPAFFRFPGWTGISAEFVSDSIGGGLVGFGAGGIIPIGERFNAGWAVAHLGPGKDGFGLPAEFRAGGMYSLPPMFKFSLDAGYGLTDKQVKVGLGIEARVHPLVVPRLGYRFRGDQGLGGLDGLSGGIGFRYRDFGLDYTFQPFGDLVISHRFAFSWAPSYIQAGGMAPESSAPTAEQDYQASLALYSAGDYSGAAAKAESAVARDIRHWQAWQMAGNCRYAKGDQAGALQAYRQSLSIQPDNPQLKSFVDSMSAAQPQQAPATADAGKIYDSSLALYSAGDYAGAKGAAEAAVAADPNHWQAWQMLGNCRYAQGDQPGALQAYRQSLALNPDNPQLKTFVDSVPK